MLLPLSVAILYNSYANVESGVIHDVEGYSGFVSYVLVLDGRGVKSQIISWS